MPLDDHDEAPVSLAEAILGAVVVDVTGVTQVAALELVVVDEVSVGLDEGAAIRPAVNDVPAASPYVVGTPLPN